MELIMDDIALFYLVQDAIIDWEDPGFDSSSYFWNRGIQGTPDLFMSYDQMKQFRKFFADSSNV
jgi:hypothetical protein